MSQASRVALQGLLRLAAASGRESAFVVGAEVSNGARAFFSTSQEPRASGTGSVVSALGSDSLIEPDQAFFKACW